MTTAKHDKSTGDKQAERIGYLVAFVWGVSFIADIAIKDYDPSPFIHAMMMTVVGALFGRKILGTNGDAK